MIKKFVPIEAETNGILVKIYGTPPEKTVTGREHDCWKMQCGKRHVLAVMSLTSMQRDNLEVEIRKGLGKGT